MWKLQIFLMFQISRLTFKADTLWLLQGYVEIWFGCLVCARALLLSDWMWEGSRKTNQGLEGTLTDAILRVEPGFDHYPTLKQQSPGTVFFIYSLEIWPSCEYNLCISTHAKMKGRQPLCKRTSQQLAPLHSSPLPTFPPISAKVNVAALLFCCECYYSGGEGRKQRAQM